MRNLLKQKQILKCLLDYGWPPNLVSTFFDHYRHHEYFEEVMLVGSPSFKALWDLAQPRSSKEAKNLLQILLKQLDFPEELSGKDEEVRQLLRGFSSDLSPHDRFWKSLAQCVQLAFPKESLSQQGLLEKMIHQCRYLISLQQSQWVRDHYGKETQTDREALLSYLKSVKIKSPYLRRRQPYTFKESSRLHNKLAIKNGQLYYPDGKSQINLKILLDFHTEFILSQDGDFLDVMTPQKQTENGVINGASFNYAYRNDALHRALDVHPIEHHDPLFRKKTCHGFRSPKLVFFIGQKDWERSYFNRKGLYAQSGKSLEKCVREKGKQMKKLLNQI